MKIENIYEWRENERGEWGRKMSRERREVNIKHYILCNVVVGTQWAMSLLLIRKSILLLNGEDQTGIKWFPDLLQLSGCWAFVRLTKHAIHLDTPDYKHLGYAHIHQTNFCLCSFIKNLRNLYSNHHVIIKLQNTHVFPKEHVAWPRNSIF